MKNILVQHHNTSKVPLPKVVSVAASKLERIIFHFKITFISWISSIHYVD